MSGDDTGTLPIGTVIDGRYRVMAALGQGGMSRLYRAEHIGIRRQVALKVLHSQLRGVDQYNERLMREAIATGRVDHKNCVTITDCGTLDDGAPYLVMELLEGQSLGDELDEKGSLPVAVSLQITRQVLVALDYAHGAGVVHRDLKPDNIFLTLDDDGELLVKVLDFGIAKLMDSTISSAGASDLTAAGMVIGSPTYMSPEQATSKAIDGRSDLYSLSVVLFEMLSGEPPFTGDDKLLLLKRKLTEPVPPMPVPPGGPIPAPVVELVRAGLAREVGDRIPTAGEYLDRLDRVLTELPAAQAVPAAQPHAPTAPVSAPAAQPHVPHAPATASRAAQAASPDALRTRRFLLAIGAIVGVVILIAIIASLAGGDKPATAADGDPHMEMDPEVIESEIRQARNDRNLQRELDEIEARVLAEEGDAVRSRLVALRRDWRNSPRVRYLLGLSYTQIRYWRDGFEELGRAIDLDPSLREDPELIKAGLRALSSRSNPERGVDFLVEAVGQPAIPYLEETAQGGSDRQREYAQRALDRLR